MLRETFTRENAAVGWSATWYGIMLGAPWMALIYTLYEYAMVNPLVLAVAWVPITWAWRRLDGRPGATRTLLTLLLAAWIFFVPLNYGFNESCRRAVRLHRNHELGPLHFVFGFLAFSLVWAATWLATGWPLSQILEQFNDPGTAGWTAFGIWLLLTPIATMAIYGRVVVAMAECCGAPAPSTPEEA